MKMCLNNFLGKCSTCLPDMDPAHFPNNTHCRGFIPVEIGFFEVLEDVKDEVGRRGEMDSEKKIRR